ncbi:glycoside hydrolase family 32 protein [Bombilactobacillus thymidiniphilus]|uniref:Glycoside hydrolase family 32 protein n=1 Tax=Bombilactobacillus thymidiniphilus TaxID=2923363 RepID=A0ABY4PBH6_9LACO|nr:glycoside hydrolase family 32 protein [Bombilactobacillus thymidiniphilus]UQS83036.1 glycoside hydrolase family 32 protein [Bombilactobacillus thymidiniphilus]
MKNIQKILKRIIFASLSIFAAIGLLSVRNVQATTYHEQYRNQFHYSPQKNWLNDPNGLYYDDQTKEYNMYYQYNPKGAQWGNMSWGHAISKDLIHWQEQQVAIPMLQNQAWEDFTYTNQTGAQANQRVRYVGNPTADWGETPNSKAIFSGSIIVDHNNLSGLGKNAVLAFYTSSYQLPERIDDHLDDGWGTWVGLSDIQEQHLAYSLDHGKTFKQYSPDGNSQQPQPIVPVTANPAGDAANFRDPNIVYDQQHQQYIMTVVSGQQALLYKSKDLLHWDYTSNIKRQKDVGLGVWECSSLVPMQVKGTATQKWVLFISVQQGAHATGSGMQYFVGNLDAKGTWHPDSGQTLANPHTLDYGEDFYAGIPFANLPNNQTIMMAWANNWSYDSDSPTTQWNGNMTLPRDLQLINDAKATDGYTVQNNVIAQTQKIIQPNSLTKDQQNLYLTNTQQKLPFTGKHYKLAATLKWDPTKKPQSVGFNVRQTPDQKYWFTIGYDVSQNKVYAQRFNTGEPQMGAPRDQMNATVKADNSQVKITAYIDETMAEVFANDGAVSITQNFYFQPNLINQQDTPGISAFVNGGSAQITDLKLQPMQSIW